MMPTLLSRLAKLYCLLYLIALTFSLPTAPLSLEPWPIQPGQRLRILDRSSEYDVYLDGILATPEETRWILLTLGEWQRRCTECATTVDLRPILDEPFYARMPNTGKKTVVMELLWPQQFTEVGNCIFLLDRLRFVDDFVVWKYGGADMEVEFFVEEDPPVKKQPSWDLRIHVIDEEVEGEGPVERGGEK